MDEQYRWILEHSDKDQNHLGSMIALYLYGRSFFLADCPATKFLKSAIFFHFFLDLQLES